MSDNQSDTSVSKSDSADMQTKYSKLAAEYSKIRAQNTVLKKAVVEEQTRTAELNEKLRNHEQTVRKLNQEMESLNFRNMQLSRRVVVLQEELENFQNNQKRKKGKVKNTSELQNGIKPEGILDEELKKMIMENATLLSTLQDKEIEYEKELTVSKQEVQKLNDELELCRHKMVELGDKYKVIIDEFKKENQAVKSDNIFKDTAIKKLEQELEDIKKSYNSYMSDINTKYETLNQSITDCLPNDDKSDQIKLTVQSLPEQNNEYFRNRFSQHIPLYVKEAIITFNSIISTVGMELRDSKCLDLLSKFDASTCTNKTKLVENLEFHLNSLNQIIDNRSQRNNETDIIDNIFKFARGFFNCLARMLTLNMKKSEDATNDSSIETQLELYADNKKTFYESCKNLLGVKNETINQLLVQLDEYVTRIYSGITEWRCKNDDNTDAIFNEKEADATSTATTDGYDQIPFSRTCKNQRDIRERITLQNYMKEELEKMKEALIISEQEKHRWLHEYNLLKLKVRNENMITNKSEQNEQITEVNNEIGKLTLSYVLDEGAIAREDGIKKYLTEKLNSVIIEKQDAYSKARTFMFETILLQKRLEHCIQEKDRIEEKLLQSKKDYLQLQEDLSTVTENYELQLRTMSEHLANVNDKLTSQTDIIEQLNYQLNNKSSHRTKLMK